MKFLRILKRWLGRSLRLTQASFHDSARFFRQSHYLDDRNNPAALAAESLRYAHSLEKGLVMPGARRPFGVEKISHLRKLAEGLKADPMFDWVGNYIEQVTRAVELVNRDNLDPTACEGVMGTEGLTAEQVRLAAPQNVEAFFRLRRSVRDFTSQVVDEAVLIRAVALAQTAPSVCNRQAGRVRFYSEPDEKKRILELQNGNKGFGHLIPTVAVISCDLRCFFCLGERNQAFVDGGLFAMTLALAFHGLGLGTCFLNWSAEPKQDQALRHLLQIPEHEVIITLLAVGHLPEKYLVAESRRRPMHEVWLRKNP